MIGDEKRLVTHLVSTNLLLLLSHLELEIRLRCSILGQFHEPVAAVFLVRRRRLSLFNLTVARNHQSVPHPDFLNCGVAFGCGISTALAE